MSGYNIGDSLLQKKIPEGLFLGKSLLVRRMDFSLARTSSSSLIKDKEGVYHPMCHGLRDGDSKLRKQDKRLPYSINLSLDGRYKVRENKGNRFTRRVPRYGAQDKSISTRATACILLAPWLMQNRFYNPDNEITCQALNTISVLIPNKSVYDIRLISRADANTYSRQFNYRTKLEADLAQQFSNSKLNSSDFSKTLVDRKTIKCWKEMNDKAGKNYSKVEWLEELRIDFSDLSKIRGEVLANIAPVYDVNLAINERFGVMTFDRNGGLGVMSNKLATLLVHADFTSRIFDNLTDLSKSLIQKSDPLWSFFPVAEYDINGNVNIVMVTDDLILECISQSTKAGSEEHILKNALSLYLYYYQGELDLSDKIESILKFNIDTLCKDPDSLLYTLEVIDKINSNKGEEILQKLYPQIDKSYFFNMFRRDEREFCKRIILSLGNTKHLHSGAKSSSMIISPSSDGFSRKLSEFKISIYYQDSLNEYYPKPRFRGEMIAQSNYFIDIPYVRVVSDGARAGAGAGAGAELSSDIQYLEDDHLMEIVLHCNDTLAKCPYPSGYPRFNHGIFHCLRQMETARSIVKAMKEGGFGDISLSLDDNGKDALYGFDINLVCLAAYSCRLGRVNELPFGNPKRKFGLTNHALACAEVFKQIALRSGINPEKVENMRQVVEKICSPDLTGLDINQKKLQFFLTLVHQIDLVRCIDMARELRLDFFNADRIRLFFNAGEKAYDDLLQDASFSEFFQYKDPYWGRQTQENITSDDANRYARLYSQYFMSHFMCYSGIINIGNMGSNSDNVESVFYSASNGGAETGCSGGRDGSQELSPISKLAVDAYYNTDKTQSLNLLKDKINGFIELKDFCEWYYLLKAKESTGERDYSLKLEQISSAKDYKELKEALNKTLTTFSRSKRPDNKFLNNLIDEIEQKQKQKHSVVLDS